MPAASYVEGQALLNGSRAFSAVAGQGLAGLLIAAATAPGALVVDALTFVASAAALARIRPAEPEPVPEPTVPGHLAAGVTFIRETPVVRAALGATATVNFFMFAFNAILILFATRELGVGPAELGLVLGAGSTGSLRSSWPACSSPSSAPGSG